MSEPVGNGPRNPIPGNTIKDRSAPREEVVVREPAQKIITGKVTTRKPSLPERMKNAMMAEDAQTIGQYVLRDIILPEFKSLLRQVIVGATDRTLWGAGGTRARGRAGDRGRNERVMYNDVVTRGREPEPRRAMSREAQARHDFREVILDSRQEAVEVLEALTERVRKYGFTSVSDLYDICGVTGSYADQRWGWSDLRDADIIDYRGSWMLDLPKPEPLRG